MQDSAISVDIEEVEHYLGELFQLPVAVAIADTTKKRLRDGSL